MITEQWLVAQYNKTVPAEQHVNRVEDIPFGKFKPRDQARLKKLMEAPPTGSANPVE